MSRDDAGYYGVLPSEVRYDMDLLPNAKLLFVEITALCRAHGYCWATNSYFADMFKTTERTIKRWVKLLCDKGYCATVIKTFRYDDGTVKKVRYICLSNKSADELKSLSQEDIWSRRHGDIERQNHGDTDVTYNKINNELNKSLMDTKVSIGPKAPVENSQPVRSQRSLEIDEAFRIWEEVMGYPLQTNKTDRPAVHNMLQRKDMDLDKLRMLIVLVKKSQADRYKRFSITDFTSLKYKQNELIAWAHEKAAQQKQDSKVVEV